uniref:Beta-1,4-galactosyltransferase n=1 Tax=Pogona vitticeps TaxID=103695 RepID=A0A6J0T0D4_9SAUR
MVFGRKMTRSQVENRWFLVFLIIFQAIFILILYRGSTSVVPQDHLDIPRPLDYSKTEDVYTNLSLYIRGTDNTSMQDCTSQTLINVGPLTITFDMLPSEKNIIDKNPYVQLGGCYRPQHCVARYGTAVIVPYRNREKQLRHFLYYLHPFLQRQQLHYCIYLIHQAGSGPFNRAKLLNIGVREALKDEDWDCLLLHNVNLIPENDYNFYICDGKYPKLMASAIDKFLYSVPYRSFFGGVTAFSPEHYLKINGFPNTYWARNGEDDDIAERIQIAGMKIQRTPFSLGRYKSADGKQVSGPRKDIKPAEVHTRKTWKDDGMNSLDFKLLAKEKHTLYMNITVDVGAPPVQSSQDKREGNKT